MGSNFINKTIGAFLDEICEQYPDNECIVLPEFGVRLTYKQFNEVVNAAAKGFMKLGVKKGDNVAIWATNRPQWLITQFATARIGAVLVTVNTNYKIFELEYLLRQSDSTTLILIDRFKDSEYVGILNELVPELKTSEKGKLNCPTLPYLKNVISIEGEKKDGMFTWDDIVEMGNDITDEELNATSNSLDPHDVINMQYTSGTTGFPKGVMLTHYNIMNNGFFIGECMKLTHKDRLCIPVPLFHCFGCVLGVMACFTHGTTMVVVDYFRPLEVMEAIQAERCTALHGVPTMFIFILEHPNFKKYDFSSLRTGIMAGSPCPIKVMKQVVSDMHASEITIAYGQTESSPVITQTTPDDELEFRVSTVGKVLPGVEARIVDPETNLPAPIGVQGEICCRGYNVMKGYYKMEEATKAAIDKDGWLHTGDLGVMDDMGYFKITGRIKDMIIRGGENVYPREIEELLYTNQKISDVQVVGVPSKELGEEIMAYIILKEKGSMTEDEVKDFVRGHMARHKTPKYVAFVDAFPMTASGKIQKYKLRDMAIELYHLKDAASIETA
jgi:fatty-acyl-CoA synthase